MLAAPLQVLSVQHHHHQQHQQGIPFGCFQQPKQNRVQHRHSQQRPQIPGQQLAKPSRSSPRKVYKVGGGLPKAQPFHQQQLQQSSMQELQRSRPPFPPELLPNAAKFRNMQAPGKHRVLCYGDSLTAGLAGNFVTEYAPYASRLSELIGCQVDHIGLSGWTTSQMTKILNEGSAVDVKDRQWNDAGLAYALKKAVEEGKPYTCVILMGGTNDLAETSPNKIVSNLMLLHHHAKAAGAVSVAVAIPKHGALVCKKYEDAMGKNAARHLRHKINTVNHTLQQAVAQANAQDENGGWISYVDAHSEVLNRVGDNPQVALDLFAGFPTLGQYRDFMLLTARSQGNRALQKVQRAFAGFTKEELGKDINHTAQGEQIRMNSPGTWSMMEDPLHFSPEGYRAFAEAMHRMVGEHIKSGFNAFTQRRASKAGPSIGLSDEVGPKKRFMSDLTPNVPTFASRQPRVSLRAASSSEQRTLSLQPSSEKQQQQQQLPLSRSSSSSGPQQQLAPIIPGYTPDLSNTQMSSGSRM